MSAITSLMPPIRVYGPVRNERKIPFQNTIRSIKDTVQGLSSSRTMRALVSGAAVIGIGFKAFLIASLALAYFGLTPPGWMSAAVIVGIVVIVACLGFLTGGSGSWKPKDIYQELGCEWGYFKRLLPRVRCLGTGFEYNEITWKGQKTLGKIFLGPMPNRLHRTHSPKQIAENEELAAVLSINAPGPISNKGERGCYGLMQPATARDWQDFGVKEYAEIDIADHTPLTSKQLEAAADFIHRNVMCLGSRNNIYVHCKAGQGRSAMAIAAYMIKYGKLSPEKALNIIENCRPRVTLRKKQKMDRLHKYHQKIERLRPTSPEL